MSHAAPRFGGYRESGYSRNGGTDVWIICNDYKLLVPGSSDGVTSLIMNSSFPEVLELK